MPEDTREGSSVQAEERPNGSSSKGMRAISKFFKHGAVIATVVTALGGWFATRYQNKMTAATLLSEREKAETSLRADMFKSLIAPIFGPQHDKKSTTENERLLVELLALNFHENFELKPLFERVDQRLQGMTKERESLQSIARRIKDRQIAALRKQGTGGASNGEGACVYTDKSAQRYLSRLWSWIMDTSDGPGACVYELIIVMPSSADQPRQKDFNPALEMLREESRPYHLVGTFGEIFGNPASGQLLKSPDGNHRLEIIVSDADWNNARLTVRIDAFTGASTVPEASYAPLTLSWTDLPLTDNTLFPDGNRFALVFYKGSLTPPVKTAELRLIWFPKEYFTPRERPLDYGEFLRVVGKKAG
ncbi:MAG: hypothetical protein C3F08_03185 [Candidatus Methylomirabilota bacterium]|nr:MAG: hypothetical protein C3F08_03185 [candidate division NC10 bacterium]